MFDKSKPTKALLWNHIYTFDLWGCLIRLLIWSNQLKNLFKLVWLKYELIYVELINRPKIHICKHKFLSNFSRTYKPYELKSHSLLLTTLMTFKLVTPVDVQLFFSTPNLTTDLTMLWKHRRSYVYVHCSV